MIKKKLETIIDNDTSAKIIGKVFSDEEVEIILKNGNDILDRVTSSNSFIFKDLDLSQLIIPEVLVEDKPIYQSETTILLARQRTGTNVFRRFLNSHQDIYAINEIFDPGIYNNKEYSHYDKMYEDLIKQSSDLIGSFFPYHYKCISKFQKPLSYKQVFSYFLNYINLFCPSKHNVIDIKYNHLHNLTDYIEPVLNKKTNIFNIIKERNLKVINLVRKNYLRSFVSGQLASKTGNYVLSKDSKNNEHEYIKVELDINQLLYAMNIIKEEDEFIYSNLKNYDKYMQIEYSDMFNTNGEFSDKLSNNMSDFFNVANSFNKTPMLKKLQNRELKDIISNYDEVEQALINTEFEYCLK